MSAPDQAARDEWRKANTRELLAEMALVRARLAGAADPDSQLPERSGRSALDMVCSCFGLSRFERQVVVLAAGAVFDDEFGAALASAQGGPAFAFPTFGLALSLLPGAHWSALSPWAPLRRWRLIESGPGNLTAAPLQLDEWLLHVLAGASAPDHRLAGVIDPIVTTGAMPGSGLAAVGSLAATWTRSGETVPVALRGTARQGRRAVFVEACSRLGLRPFVMAAADVPATAHERDDLVHRWEREARFDPAALLIEVEGDAGALSVHAIDRFIDALTTAVAVADEGRPLGCRPPVVVEIGRPGPDEQRRLWSAALSTDRGFASLNGALDQVVAHFDLDHDAILAAARRALGSDAAADPGERVWQACRVSARGGLDALAQRLDTAATFEDLVLPDAQRQLLSDIIAHVRHRSKVYEVWGMAGPARSGLGVSALFAGPSGTGKTLAAAVVANALDLDLYRVDLSQAVSKYIGETEKNLRRVFATAAESGAVLLFDEADALFGKRSEVRDSHDRYANLEVSYLLQAMENYSGLAILTTNQRAALDSAFLRRLRFVVTFPFPGPRERAQIWARAFATSAPTRDLDMAKLSQLAVAGGSIRSIALHAAFTAAEHGSPIGMGEVLRAAATEYTKLERPLTDVEIGGWL